MTEFESKVVKFIETLQEFKLTENTFNMWADYDKSIDIEKAGEKRRNNLKEYLIDREEAKVILIGEAPGYKGCRFSGIPFMDEQILVNEIPNGKITSTEYDEKAQKETSSQTVWNTCFLKNNPKSWVAWNAFPIHPHKKENKNTNRTPKAKELDNSAYILVKFLELFPDAKIIPVGCQSKAIFDRLIKKKNIQNLPNISEQESKIIKKLNVRVLDKVYHPSPIVQNRLPDEKKFANEILKIIEKF